MEKIEVRGFAGIQEANIQIKQFTVFIGHQASGKSVCAKLVYYFRQILSNLPLDVASGNNKTEIKKKHKADFIRYFPVSAWGNNPFDITYVLHDLTFIIRSKNNKQGVGLEIIYSDVYENLLSSLRKEIRKYQDNSDDELGFFRIVKVNGQETIIDTSPSSIMIDLGKNIIHSEYVNTNYFIPAGRSFFSTLQSNVFSFISTSIDMDPFLIEFGRLYERMRVQFNSTAPHQKRTLAENKTTIKKIIKGDYSRISGNDYIVTSDERSVPIGSTSSGQQEALPLLVLLTVIRRNILGGGVNLFIEEPEAHLFPDTQKDLIDFIFTSLNKNKGICIITTHSPYILSEINNIMYRGHLLNITDNKKIQAKLNGNANISPDKVEAYHFRDGLVSRIIDPEQGMIDALKIDNVSNIISNEFDELMTIEANL